MRIKKNIFGIFFITLFTMLTVFSNTVFAAAQIDASRSTSLTIRYKVNKNPVSDIEFKLYRVADISVTGKFTAVGDFAGYAVSYNRLTSEGWTDLARTLEGYVYRDKPNPEMSGTTDKNGTIYFSGCKQGLYLLLGERHISGQYIYTPQSLLVSLPGMNEDGSWNYDVTCEPKFSSLNTRMITDIDSSYSNQTVKKVWADDTDTSKRPENIIVQLLCDDVVYDEMTLNESNNWQYTWLNLSDAYTWRIVEKSVPDGYTVSVGWDGYVFTVTNAIPGNDSDDPDDPPTDPSNHTTSPEPQDVTTNANNPSDPDNPDASNATTGPDAPNSEGLPQTGMLKWPIPVMFILGAGIFVAGYFYRKKGTGTNDEDE